MSSAMHVFFTYRLSDSDRPTRPVGQGASGRSTDWVNLLSAPLTDKYLGLRSARPPSSQLMVNSCHSEAPSEHVHAN